MNRTIVPNGGPKLRLIDAAEKLFAEKGFDVVSVRDITQAAGGNVAAVNYHFGSRDGLVAVVMTRYMTPVNEERLVRLEAAERKWAGKAVPIGEVVDAFVRPLITQVSKSELSEKMFSKLIGRIFSTQCNGMPAEIEAQLVVLIERFTRVLSKSLPTLAEEDLMWRLHFAVGAMIHMLTHGEALQRLSHGASGTPAMEATLSRFLSFAVAGLCDGVPGPQPTTQPMQSDVSAAIQLDGERDLDPPGPESNIEDPGPPPPNTGEAEPAQKPEKKKTKKAELESPQVMFEF